MKPLIFGVGILNLCESALWFGSDIVEGDEAAIACRGNLKQPPLGRNYNRTFCIRWTASTL